MRIDAKVHRTTRILGIKGAWLILDGKPSFFQGLSFFNANFNRSDAGRLHWLRAFRANGISCLRVWCK